MHWYRLALLLCLGCSGCHSINGYAVPRALPRGSWELYTASELSKIRRTESAPAAPPFSGKTTREFVSLVLVPTDLGVRRGLGGGVEIGGRLHFSAMAASASLKAQIREGDISVALLASGKVGVHLGLVELPVLLGARLWEGVTLVVSPGLAYTQNANLESYMVMPEGLQLRGGVGVRIRKSKWFSWHPEVTYMRSVDSSTSWLTWGLGFVVGDR